MSSETSSEGENYFATREEGKETSESSGCGSHWQPERCVESKRR